MTLTKSVIPGILGVEVSKMPQIIPIKSSEDRFMEGWSNWRDSLKNKGYILVISFTDKT